MATKNTTKALVVADAKSTKEATKVVVVAEAKVFGKRNTDEIMAAMDEENEQGEQELIATEMNPALREKYEQITNWIRREYAQGLKSRYELGQIVLDLYRDETQNGAKKYGANAINNICKLLKWGSDVVRSALTFAQAYTREQVEDMCSWLGPKGQPLTWSHMRSALSIEDDKQRDELLHQAADNGWTSFRMNTEVKRTLFPEPRENMGRPPRSPKDFDGAIALQLQSSDAWIKSHSRVWADEKKNLPAQVAKLKPEEVTESRIGAARMVAARLRQVADQAAQQAKMAEAVVKEMEEKLKSEQETVGE